MSDMESEAAANFATSLAYRGSPFGKRGELVSASNQSRHKEEKSQESAYLMEQIVSRENMVRAYKRVLSNKGAPGLDGLGVMDLKTYLEANWTVIRTQLLLGEYYPLPVKKVEIPKAGGGKRELGIPTVFDRLLQQAIHQTLQPMYDPEFSDWSYGFRPGRSAQQAVSQSKSHIQSGNSWVIDMDLSKFFDEVPHDRLISKLRIKIMDRRVIHLIERYLRAGIMEDGLVSQREKGTPQGGPISPLLSNIVLDELDKELEKRGHRFIRYADDFQIYVGSRRSAERVQSSLTNFLEGRLKLKVNREKSAIGRVWERSFLGYGFTRQKSVRLTVSKESIKRLKAKMKARFHEGRGRNQQQFIVSYLNPLIKGWITYFSKSETMKFAQELDSWIRRHLRKILWRQMKRPWTRFQALIKRGLSEIRAAQSCFNQRGAWWNAGSSHMNQAYPKSFFNHLGLVSLQDELSRYRL